MCQLLCESSLPECREVASDTHTLSALSLSLSHTHTHLIVRASLSCHTRTGHEHPFYRSYANGTVAGADATTGRADATLDLRSCHKSVGACNCCRHVLRDGAVGEIPYIEWLGGADRSPAAVMTAAGGCCSRTGQWRCGWLQTASEERAGVLKTHRSTRCDPCEVARNSGVPVRML